MILRLARATKQISGQPRLYNKILSQRGRQKAEARRVLGTESNRTSLQSWNWDTTKANEFGTWYVSEDVCILHDELRFANGCREARSQRVYRTARPGCLLKILLKKVYWSAQSATTKWQGPGGLTEVTLEGLAAPFLKDFFWTLCRHLLIKSSYGRERNSLHFFNRTISLPGWGSTLKFSFNQNYQLKIPSPNTVTLGVSVSA